MTLTKFINYTIRAQKIHINDRIVLLAKQPAYYNYIISPLIFHKIFFFRAFMMIANMKYIKLQRRP